jgi:hypothetical protein
MIEKTQWFLMGLFSGLTGALVGSAARGAIRTFKEIHE